MGEIVNVMASGFLGREFDLAFLASNLDVYNVQYEPETFPALQLRFKEDGPVLMIYSTGSFNIMGAKSEEEVQNLYERLVIEFDNFGVEIDKNKVQLEIKNMIYKDKVGRELDLSALTVGLGLEESEYDPDVSPFVYYWPTDMGCLITIPSNGEVIVTGVTTIKQAEDAFEHLRSRIDSLFQETT